MKKTKLHGSGGKYRRLPASAQAVLRQSFGRKRPLLLIASGNLNTKEAINPTRLIAAHRGSSQRISATMKFDVRRGLKGRKIPLLLIASGNLNAKNAINNTPCITADRSGSRRIFATKKFGLHPAKKTALCKTLCIQ